MRTHPDQIKESNNTTEKSSDSKKIGQESFFLHLKKIKVAKDNSFIYGNFGIENGDDEELTISIKEKGIIEPLVLSSDYVLLSGHRRLHAAKYLGLQTVPVRVIDECYEDLTYPERVELLRRFNFQRDKTPAERLNEKLVGIDPMKAYKDLELKKLFTDAGTRLPNANINLGQIKTRSRITTLQFLNAVIRVVQANEEYLPLTDRRVHYLLLNDPPLRHDKKPDSRYKNDKSSYKALTNLLLRARLTGYIQWRAIEDSTRPIQLGGGFSSPEEFIKQETDNFLVGYSRNLMQGQPHHIEIMLEKNALRTVIESVAREYNVPITTGRGYSSLSPRYEIFKRYRYSGKKKLILLMLTDFDPDGEEIAASFARSMRDDFGIKDIQPIKVALTAQDVRDNDLPSDMDAKVSSPNYKKFVATYGTKVVELDAAPVKMLQAHLRSKIESVIDVTTFNAQVELANNDAAIIQAHRQVVFEALRS